MTRFTQTNCFTVYQFRARLHDSDPLVAIPGKCTIEQAREIYGPGNYELIAATKESVQLDIEAIMSGHEIGFLRGQKSLATFASILGISVDRLKRLENGHEDADEELVRKLFALRDARRRQASDLGVNLDEKLWSPG